MKEQSYLFEVSWEVCNKVGGIHTVLTSKMSWAQKEFPGHYFAVGPYFSEGTPGEFQELALPPDLQKVADMVSPQGITLHYGTWNIPTTPPVLLIAWEGLVGKLNDLKSRYWERYQLDSLNTDFYDVDQPLLWSTAIGMVVEAYSAVHNEPTIVHAHEWMSGGAILYLNSLAANSVKTVFTTHATVLGRALSGQGISIYDDLHSIDPTEAAKTSGVTTKHQIEAFSAQNATVFTTVSQVTAEEAARFLGREADIITENGLNLEDFLPFDALSIRRQAIRTQLEEFVAAYFFPYYHIDLNATSYQFTMGRYEPHNKGYDVYLESLGQLNTQLKEEGSGQTVLSFFLVPGDHLAHTRVTHAQFTCVLAAHPDFHRLG